MPWWEPEYEEANGRLRFTVSGCATNECPISLITGNSLSLLETFARARAASHIGASIGSLEDWPARVVDAFIVFSNEDVKYQEARESAISRLRQRNQP